MLHLSYLLFYGRGSEMSNFLSKIEHTVLVFSLAVMSIITFANIISRFFLSSSFAFTEEVTVNLFVLITFLGAAVGIKRKSHLAFSLLYDTSSRNLRLALAIFAGAMTILIFAITTYYGVDMMLFQAQLKQTTPALGWPQWIFSMGLPLGSLFCVYRSLEATIKEVKELRKEDKGSEIA